MSPGVLPGAPVWFVASVLRRPPVWFVGLILSGTPILPGSRITILKATRRHALRAVQALLMESIIALDPPVRPQLRVAPAPVA